MKEIFKSYRHAMYGNLFEVSERGFQNIKESSPFYNVFVSLFRNCEIVRCGNLNCILLHTKLSLQHGITTTVKGSCCFMVVRSLYGYKIDFWNLEKTF